MSFECSDITQSNFSRWLVPDGGKGAVK